jgi:hypothetical protein
VIEVERKQAEPFVLGGYDASEKETICSDPDFSHYLQPSLLTMTIWISQMRKKKTVLKGTICPEVIRMRKNAPTKRSFWKAVSTLLLLAVLGTLAIVQPDGSVKFYATFPMGGTQMSVLELDTGKTWMIRTSDEHGNTGTVIDYDSGDIYQWDTTDGCRRCGGWQQMEK